MSLVTFRKQISEDLSLFEKEYVRQSENLKKKEYAFNFWILTELFHVEPEIANEYILEYNDGGIDCYVHYDENKELYLIQNKYYDKHTGINRESICDFLTNPLVQLKEGNYKKSQQLQNIFTDISEDPDYKILLLFITTSERPLSEQTLTLFSNFNREPKHGLSCGIYAEFVDFQSLYTKYYGIEYVHQDSFQFELQTYLGKGYAAVLEDYDLKLPYETYYIITPIIEIYKMHTKAERDKYPLFDKNIREFLGENPINNAIIQTLNNPDTREFFLYYNNGITINCDDKIKSKVDSKRMLTLSNPKVVNGCQTVNSIKLAVDAVPETRREEAFKKAFVLVKVLIITSHDDRHVEFYKNVVKYTNKQNAIPAKSFVLVEKREFEKVRDGLKNRGILACIKASDKNMYRSYSVREKNDVLARIKEYAEVFPDVYTTFNDTLIEFEKILQILVAFLDSPQIAIQKKSLLLKESSEWFLNFSSKIQDYFTSDNWVILISYYKKAFQMNKKVSNPVSPFYMIGFLGFIIREYLDGKENDFAAMREQLSYLFRSVESTNEVIDNVERLCRLYSSKFYKENECDYNTMIKSAIDLKMLDSAYEDYNSISTDNAITKLFLRKD